MLSQLEEKLKTLIKESDAPFLGLIGESLDAATRTAIDISVVARPDVKSYIGYLRVYPALFSVNLTYHLMQGMGQAGHFDIYPHIQHAIGTDSHITQIEKEQLWKAFRLALQNLGYQPSPRTSGNHYMVDEYLRQTGVPLRFVDDLAERMIAFARTVGLPEEDNPEAISNWQSILDAKLGSPFSITARKAIQSDKRGYYTQTFLKISAANGRTSGTSNTLEKAMASAFQKLPNKPSFKRAVLPHLVNNEGVLGIFVPGGEGREFELVVDGERQPFRSGAEERFIPINVDLPKEVIVRNIASNQTNKYKLWEDNKSNRLLIFTDRGLYKDHVQLGGETVHLAPGTYQFISRFEPDGQDIEELLDDPQLFIFSLTIHPGKQYILSNGPARLTIQGEDEPFAYWRGERKVTKEGVEFFFGDIHLDLEFPAEWLSINGQDCTLFLTASGINQRIETPFSFDANGKATIGVSQTAAEHDWKPGFGRIKAEIFRAGDHRSLLHTSVLFWHGLNSISRELRFDCQKMPCNLEKPLCENIEANGTSLKVGDRISRSIRLVFKLDEQRNQALTWNLPGVFIEVETPSEKGTTQRFKRQPGDIEVVSYTSPKQILVLASDPGELRIGNWTQYVDFPKTPTKRLPAAFLASRLTPQANTLIYRNDISGTELELLRLVQPHTVDKLTATISNGQFVINIASQKEIDSLLVRAADVFSGQDLEIELPANQGTYTSHRFGRAQLMCVKGEAGSFGSFVYFDLDIWPKGAWIFHFEGKIDGGWGRLEDSNQHQFATSLVSKDDEGGFTPGQSLTTPTAIANWLTQLQELPDRDSLQVFGRIHEAMLAPYTADTMAQLQWLERAWTVLLERWKGREDEAGPLLLNLIGAKRAEDTKSNWLLPRLIHSTLPKILCLPAKAYKKIKEDVHPVMRALQLMPDIQDNYPALFPAPLHLAVAAGFTNFMEVAQGSIPKGFSLTGYTQALASTLGGENRYRLDEMGFQIKSGDFLGPLHFLHAIQELELAYESATATNQTVLGQAVKLASYLHRVLPSLTKDDASDLAGLSPHIDPWPGDADEILDDEVAQRRDNLNNIGRLLSWYAYHCRLDAKVPGHLDQLYRKLEASEVRVKRVMTYLMQIGDALFAYYLLLWEFIIKAKCIGG